MNDLKRDARETRWTTHEQYSPVPYRSVPPCRKTAYSCADNLARHSSSLSWKGSGKKASALRVFRRANRRAKRSPPVASHQRRVLTGGHVDVTTRPCAHAGRGAELCREKKQKV